MVRLIQRDFIMVNGQAIIVKEILLLLNMVLNISEKNIIVDNMFNNLILIKNQVIIKISHHVKLITNLNNFQIVQLM